MKLFHRSVKNEIEDEGCGKVRCLSEMQLDEIMRMVAKNTCETDDRQVDNMSLDLENSVSNKIKAIREEYDNTVAELLPVKWELIEKKSEIDKIRSEYNALLIELNYTKEKLYSIKSEILDIKSQIDVKRNELLKMQSETTRNSNA